MKTGDEHAEVALGKLPRALCNRMTDILMSLYATMLGKGVATSQHVFSDGCH